jgi:hypothetical protein
MIKQGKKLNLALLLKAIACRTQKPFQATSPIGLRNLIFKNSIPEESGFYFIV